MKDNLSIMKQCEAFLEGHFLLSSGRHSGGYCQCAKLLRFPELSAEVLSTVTEQVKNLPITKVCGPAMGGIIVSYELARQLGVESIFTERKDGEMQLRRGFTVGKGDKILIAEDVITTGKLVTNACTKLKSVKNNANNVTIRPIANPRNRPPAIKPSKIVCLEIGLTSISSILP